MVQVEAAPTHPPGVHRPVGTEAAAVMAVVAAAAAEVLAASAFPFSHWVPLQTPAGPTHPTSCPTATPERVGEGAQAAVAEPTMVPLA